jgi:hypothetical protein
MEILLLKSISHNEMRASRIFLAWTACHIPVGKGNKVKNLLNEKENVFTLGDSGIGDYEYVASKLMQDSKALSALRRITREKINNVDGNLLLSSIQHIGDVQLGMNFFAEKLIEAGRIHDHTKLSGIDEFYSDFKTSFKTIGWWNNHKQTERHHLSMSGVIPEDVNLIDVIEYIIDGAMAGMARSGEYRKEEIPEGLLELAFNNTIKLLLSKIEVID